MKVKKYTATSMPEVMKLIRSELGSDAVILNSKVIHTGGFLGFFKKRNIEVLAAVDQNVMKHAKPVIKEKVKGPISTQKLVNPLVEKQSIPAFPNSLTEKPNEELMKEIQQLKGLFKNAPISSSNGGITLPIPIQEIQTKLRMQDVDGILQDEIVSYLLEHWYIKGANATTTAVNRWAKDFLIKKLEPLSFGEISLNKKFVNVVGPTGVGKTTTLAKMAAECVLKHKKKVAFFTSDTYRIGAIEQLKTYANILNVPLEVCYNFSDFEAATIKYMEDYDIILVDTAGRNFRKQKYVEDLAKVIDYNKEIETFLVLSLTGKQSDMEEIYTQFSLIDIDKFIFTKTDETSSYGAMVNMMLKFNKGVAYLTTGQNVPDDIISASPEDIVNRIFGDE